MRNCGQGSGTFSRGRGEKNACARGNGKHLDELLLFKRSTTQKSLTIEDREGDEILGKKVE